jgi:hypothetical protein
MSLSEYFKRFILTENNERSQLSSKRLNNIIGPFHETSAVKYYLKPEQKSEIEEAVEG